MKMEVIKTYMLNNLEYNAYKNHNNSNDNNNNNNNNNNKSKDCD